MNREQRDIDTFFKQEGWLYWSPHEILARLMEETGELARLVNHVYGPKKKKTEESTQEFADEVGDILYTLACFATTHGINLDEALQQSIDKVKTRDQKRFSPEK